MDSLCPAGGGTSQNYLSIEDIIMSGRDFKAVNKKCYLGMRVVRKSAYWRGFDAEKRRKYLNKFRQKRTKKWWIYADWIWFSSLLLHSNP